VVEDDAAQGVAKAIVITERLGHHSKKEGEDHVEVRQKELKGIGMQDGRRMRGLVVGD
jgi:hypothetical protein